MTESLAEPADEATAVAITTTTVPELVEFGGGREEDHQIGRVLGVGVPGVVVLELEERLGDGRGGMDARVARGGGPEAQAAERGEGGEGGRVEVEGERGGGGGEGPGEEGGGEDGGERGEEEATGGEGGRGRGGGEEGGGGGQDGGEVGGRGGGGGGGGGAWGREEGVEVEEEDDAAGLAGAGRHGWANWTPAVEEGGSRPEDDSSGREWSG